MLTYGDEEFQKEEDIRCRLIGYGKCFTKMITFTNEDYTKDGYDKWLLELKNDTNIKSLILKENGQEVVLLERQ